MSSDATPSPRRVRSANAGGAPPQPFGVECPGCDAAIWIDIVELPLEPVGTHKVGGTVTDIAAGSARCSCGAQVHVEHHRSDGFHGPHEELIAGDPTYQFRAVTAPGV